MINLSKTRIRRYKNIPVGTTKAPEMAVSGAFFRLVILLAIVKLPVMAAPANVIADTSLDVSWLTSGETNENIDMDLKTAWILVVVAIVLVIIAIENIK